MLNSFQNSGRIEFIDLAKGICIILVVAFHATGLCNVEFPLHSVIKTFRMPLYFCVSGLFFKRYENFYGFLKRKTNKIAIPFFFFFILTSVLLPNALHWIGLDTCDSEHLGWPSLYAFITPEDFPNIPIWFLLCLFWVNTIFYGIVALSEKISKEDGARICSVIVLTALCRTAGYGMSTSGINLPAFIDTALSCMPFFCFGYLLRRYTNVLIPNTMDKHIPLWLIILAGVTFYFRGGEEGLGFDPNETMMNIIIGGFAGSLAVLLLSKWIGHLPLVSYLGRYSIIILCTHLLVLKGIWLILQHIWFSEVVPAGWMCVITLTIVMFSYLAIIPLCIKFIPWFTAQKDLIKV